MAACGPLPPATPPVAEMGTLERRVERSYADVESVLRFAAGRWAQGDRDGTVRMLGEARAAVPEASVYAAALGTAHEGLGDYLTARDSYLAFLDETPPSALGQGVVERVSAIRGRTAAPLVERLRRLGATLDHRADPTIVVSLRRLTAADPSLVRLAPAATELLGLELRERHLEVLDWELVDAAWAALDAGGAPRAVALDVGALLTSRRVVWGELERVGGDSVSVALHVLRVDGRGGTAFADDTVTVSLDSYGRDRGRITHLAWELLIGAVRGSTSDVFEPPRTVATEALLTMGDGLAAMAAADEAGAGAAFETARALASDFPPLLARVAQLETFVAAGESTTLPLAEEALDFARRRTAASYLLRESTGASALMRVTRHGVGEAFGLDRLGSQVFVDFLISTTGGR